jgi:ribosomal protein S12 methylthiotransferase accessory factor
LGGFPEPGFDLEEIASAPNLEIHFVDSSGVVSWNFLGDSPDFEFADWNFSATTEEDYQWQLARLHADGHDAYIADFTHLGVYACRILVPGMSEIYPVDDLEWENTSAGNAVRPAILRLSELDDEECADLLATLDDLGFDDQRPVAGLIGLAPDPGTLWEDLRVGELKALLALAVGDEEATREGCDWIRHFEQLDEARRRVYRCVEALLNLAETDRYAAALRHLYGAEALEQAQALLDGKLRFFDIPAPGMKLAGCDMHQRLLAAYGKVHNPPGKNPSL